MRRRARFICPSEQQPDREATFRLLVSQGPWRREDGLNRWYLYRRTFDLPSLTEAATLDITLDGRYQLFINGKRVGRGPSRCSPEYQRVDHHDIASYLVEGENVIGVLAHVYGVDTAWYQLSRDYLQSAFGDGGLYVDASIDCGDGEIAILSDASWRCLECEAWNRDTPRSGWGQDFIEDFDARNWPAGWALPGYDDSGWSAVGEMVLHAGKDDRAKGWGAMEPFPTLLPREIPQLSESLVSPVEVAGISTTVAEPVLALDERIYTEQMEEGGHDLVSNSQALLADDPQMTIVRTVAGKDTALLLRFDRLHSGYPFIEIEARGGEIVEVAVAETIPGEYLGESEQPARIRLQTFLDCAQVFRYTARPGLQRFEKFEWTAVRYMQIVVREAPHGLKIRHAGSVYTHYPAENLGAFECSDGFLNRLWEMGRYTALQCTHDAWEDCPGREKRQWIGDGIVHYLIHAAAFGVSTRPIDRQFLRHAMESQRPDGLIQMFTPGDHHDKGIVIPDFSLHWIGAVHHYFQHYGDLNLIAELFPAIERNLSWFERQTGPGGLIVDLPYWHFIEWADIERSGESLTINAMLAGALRSAASLADALGYDRAAGRYSEQAQGMADAMNERFWDEERGAYVDSVDPESGERHRKISQQANGTMICWDIAPRSRWPRMIERVTDLSRLKLTEVPPIVLDCEPFDPEQDVVLANTYFSHFVFSALGKAGRFDLALGQIRRFYEPMLATGTTTLWEGFEPAASLCHAFSGTPVYQLSANVLGVQPTEPGFGKARIAPQLCDLDYAQGAYPTVHGNIQVSWRRAGDRLQLDIELPAGVSAEVTPPHGFQSESAGSVLGPGSHSLLLNAASIR